MTILTQNGATIDIKEEDMIVFSVDVKVVNNETVPLKGYVVTKSNYRYDVSYDGKRWILLEVTEARKT